MEQASATIHNDTTTEMDTRPWLFNDAYFSRSMPPAAYNTFAPFSRLPTELRLCVWLLCFRQHRMIEVGIRAPDEEEKPVLYAYPNHLGRVVSGRNYSIEIRGSGYAASLHPLLWFNSEARQAALCFYRVHLPFPRQDGEQVLYLNPEDDVLYVQPKHRPEILNHNIISLGTGQS
ncbi:hypothetical protein C8A03DRAFT_14317 [Achaetomium macrosporum]|uniref:2EXR domain-containing protein n=1 Tax=Achaetomium macrosporum TaxID=79813 RepID=A0AAN7CC88_9PEZI|nr:hypothetical protein C8A03DRAFT_14317 [Achaetomium macrosporum]